MRPLGPLFAALALVPALATAQPVRRSSPGRPATRPAPAAPVRAVATPEEGITTAEVSAHLRFLASDELLGRKPGTPGGAAAARYVAEQFRLAGALPAPGTDDYYQWVPMASVTPATDATLTLGGATLATGRGLVVLAGDAADVRGAAVRVPTGLSAAEYAGLDVRGRVVVTAVGDGQTTNPQAAMRVSARKLALADSLGAAGLVEVYRLALPWTTLAPTLAAPRMERGPRRALVHAWADGANDALAATAASPTPDVRLVSSGAVRHGLDSPNVVAVVRGTDPALRDEYVAMTAHYDHVGTGRDRGPAPAPGVVADTIFNGARDNGTGTVALIAAARALAASPPRRSVLLISYTAEEMGLVGSRYFAEHPLVPLRQIVGAFNVDTGGISDTTVVTLIGAGRTTMDAAVDAGARAFGLAMLADPAPEQGLFDRSDNVALAARGIPAPTFSPGFRAFTDPGVANFYHRVADEADETYPFTYLRRFAQAYTRAARLIADAPARPTWTPGDRYEAAARALYGR